MKQILIFFTLLLSSTFVYANGPNPWAFHPIRYASNPVQCYSIRFYDEELKKSVVVLYDYDEATGTKMKRPWTVVEEGKCYERGGNFLIFKKEIIDKAPDILNPVEYGPEKNLVTWTGLDSNVDTKCPESLKKQNLRFCDITTDTHFFEDGLIVIPVEAYVGTYMLSDILKPLETMKDSEAYMNLLNWMPSNDDPEYRELSPRKDYRKADIGLATCDKRIKINHEIGLKKYMVLSQYPVIDQQHGEEWIIGGRTVVPLMQSKSFTVDDTWHEEKFDTWSHMKILIDFESMGCLNDVLNYIATMRYNYDMGAEPYVRFDGEYFVQPKGPQVKYSDYFTYEKLRFETLKKVVGFGVASEDVSEPVSVSVPLDVESKDLNLSEDSIIASEINNRKMYVSAGSMYWYLPIFGLLTLAGVILYRRKK